MILPEPELRSDPCEARGPLFWSVGAKLVPPAHNCWIYPSKLSTLVNKGQISLNLARRGLKSFWRVGPPLSALRISNLCRWLNCCSQKSYSLLNPSQTRIAESTYRNNCPPITLISSPRFELTAILCLS